MRKVARLKVWLVLVLVPCTFENSLNHRAQAILIKENHSQIKYPDFYTIIN